jgi:hypothetical protein
MSLGSEIYRRLIEELPSLDIKEIENDDLEWIESKAFIGVRYPEPELLLAAREGRILIASETDNINIKVSYSNEAKGKKVPGLFMISQRADLDTIINELILLIQNSSNPEWDGKLLYIPLN